MHALRFPILGRRRIALGAAAVALAGAGLVTAVFAGIESTVVTVTAGRPTEFAFTLSKTSRIPLGTVTFKVTNRGVLPHRFKVCATPAATARLNACKGPGTRTLAPEKSATLKISFRKRGTYEYLSAVPGQAAKGMKGLIGVGVPLPAPAAPKGGSTAVTTAPATVTPTTTAPALAGDAAAGAEVWASAGCGGCHTIGEARGNVGPDLNLTHPGPFASGPLTAKQLADLAAYVDGAGQ